MKTEVTTTQIPLHDYQIYAKDFIKTHPFCGLFLDMGLGKTLITLTALYELGITGQIGGHILIIAPKTIARTTWINEIRKWNIPVNTKSLIVNEKGKDLSRKERLAIYDEIPSAPPTLYFINKEKVNDLIDNTDQWFFPTVIIDESQSFKGYKSNRFKGLKKVRPDITRLIELTGTPTPNGLEDLWSQIYLMDMGERLGRNITAYRETFFDPGRPFVNGYPVNWIPKDWAKQEIYRRISDIVISMENTMLVLPDLIFNDVKFAMDDEEKQLYKDMMKDYVLEFGDGTEVEAANAAVLTAKLSQMASGTLYTDKDGTYKIIHHKKCELAQYIVDNTDGPSLIAYHFKSEQKELMKWFEDHGYIIKSFDGSPEMTDEWNNGRIPIMLIQPASAGYGVNIQYGGHTLIWYTVSWSLEEYLQTNARIYRQGQTHTTVIHHLIAEKTIDERKLKAIEKKDLSQQELLYAVKATIDDINN